MKKYREWLNLQIEFLRSDEWRNQDDDLPGILDEARQRAVDLGLVDALESLNNPDLLVGCVGALASLSGTLSTQDVATQLGVSPDTVLVWLKSGRLAGLNAGNHWEVAQSAVDDMLAEKVTPIPIRRRKQSGKLF